MEELAKKKGISMAQFALAWSLANEFITAPIVGTTNLESLKELIGESLLSRIPCSAAHSSLGILSIIFLYPSFYLLPRLSSAWADEVAATHIKLTTEEKKYIDEVYEPLQVVSPEYETISKLTYSVDMNRLKQVYSYKCIKSLGQSPLRSHPNPLLLTLTFVSEQVQTD